MKEITSVGMKYADLYEKETNKTPSHYIVSMLDKTIRWKPRDVNGLGLYLAGNNKLVNSDRLTDIEVSVLFKVLESSPIFVVINLSYNNLGDKAAEAIAEYLEENSSLQKLNLMCNEIGEKGAEMLANSFVRNQFLSCLKMNGNKIGKKGALAFAQVLQINTTLKELDLGHTDQTIDSIIALAVVLQFTNSTLKSLNISRPLLKGEDHECVLVHIGQLLKINETLKELHLAKIGIRDFGATRISDALMYNTSLTHLDLSSNRIGEDGAKVLGDAILITNCLQYLDLGYNRIKDPGVKYLAEMLQRNTSLNTLVLVSNCFGSPGLLSLISVLQHSNSTLSAVFIWGNEFHPDASKAFADLLSTSRLTQANVDVKPYKVDGLYYLSQLNHHPSRHFYWEPSYGDDVPHTQIYGNGFETRPLLNLDVKSLQ